MWLLLAVPLCIWILRRQRASGWVLIAALVAGSGLMALHERALQTSAVAPLLDKKISFHIVASVVTDPKLGEPKQMQGYVKPATTTAIVSVISMKVHNVTRNLSLIHI